MTGHDIATRWEGHLLAEAFPQEIRADAMLAGSRLTRRLLPRLFIRHDTERFAAWVAGQQVLIPQRLYYRSHRTHAARDDASWLVERALQTRSSDGFARQRAVRDLLDRPKPWTAPFIAALIGEYVIEILEDIDAGMTTELEQVLAEFIVCNGAYWATTKRRITSYWSAYYRYSSPERSVSCKRQEYVGFKLADRLDAAAARCLKEKSD